MAIIDQAPLDAGKFEASARRSHVASVPMTARHALTSMKRLVLFACVVMPFFLARALPAEAAASPANATYSPIDYPGASSTEANAVNRTSSIVRPVEVVGTYHDIQGAHGFLLSGGQYTRLDVPGGTSTRALGINAHHEIVGTYRDNLTARTCNFKYSQGTYTHVLGSCVLDGVRGINNVGALVGRTCCSGLPSHHTGFVRSPTLFSDRLDVPGATEAEARGIDNNALPHMVGYYSTSDHHKHGALWTGNGNTGASFDVAPGAYETVANGINDSGQIVGSFTDARNRHRRGFLRGAEGDKTLAYPGAQLTSANGINNPDVRGRFNVVGTYHWNSAFTTRGFIATVSPLVGGTDEGAR